MSAVAWAKEHPGLAIGGAIAVVLIVAMASGGSKSDATGGNSGAVAAYYGAVANQAQAGAAIQMAQIQANAGTNQALIAASYGIQKEQIDATSAGNIAGIQAGVASKALDVQSAAIASNERLQANQQAVDLALGADAHRIAMSALGTKRIDSAGKTAVLESAITGQPVAPVYGPVNQGNSASSIINSIGNVVKSVAPFGLF